VEREGLALTVMVHYEKKPSFCTHYKMLGHDLHSCLKLISLTQQECTSKGTKQAQSVPLQNMHQSKSNWIGKAPAHAAKYTQSENFMAGTNHTQSQAGKFTQTQGTILQHNSTVTRSQIAVVCTVNNTSQGPFTVGSVPEQFVVTADSLVNNTAAGKAPTQSQGPVSTHLYHDVIGSKVHNNNLNGKLTVTNQESVDVAEIAAVQKGVDPSTLPLQNSYDLLQDDCELPSEKERLADMDSSHISNDTLLESAKIVDKVSGEIVSLDQDAHSKVSVYVEYDTNEPAMSVATNDAVVESDTRSLPKHALLKAHQPISGPRELSNLTQIVHSKPLDNMLHTETLSSKLTTLVDSVSHAMDPSDFHFFTCEYLGKHGMTDIIENPAIIIPHTTTYEILGPNKRKITQSANTSNTSEACRKSEKILRKFWADDLDTDSTLEPETDTDRNLSLLSASPEADRYLMLASETSKKGKRGRPRKTKSPKAQSSIKIKGRKLVASEDTSHIVHTKSKTHSKINNTQCSVDTGT